MARPLSDHSNPYQPPKVDTLIDLSGSQDCGFSVHKKTVIIGKNCRLPFRCIVCNQPAASWFKKRFYWYPPWHSIAFIASFFGLGMLMPYLPKSMIILVAIHPLLCLLIISLLRRQSKIKLGLCTTHHKRNNNCKVLQVICIVGIVASFVVLVSYSGSKFIGLTLLALAILFITVIILNFYRVHIRVVGITEDTTKLKGFGREFLRSLP